MPATKTLSPQRAGRTRNSSPRLSDTSKPNTRTASPRGTGKIDSKSPSLKVKVKTEPIEVPSRSSPKKDVKFQKDGKSIVSKLVTERNPTRSTRLSKHEQNVAEVTTATSPGRPLNTRGIQEEKKTLKQGNQDKEKQSEDKSIRRSTRKSSDANGAEGKVVDQSVNRQLMKKDKESGIQQNIKPAKENRYSSIKKADLDTDTKTKRKRSVNVENESKKQDTNDVEFEDESSWSDADQQNTLSKEEQSNKKSSLDQKDKEDMKTTQSIASNETTEASPANLHGRGQKRMNETDAMTDEVESKRQKSSVEFSEEVYVPATGKPKSIVSAVVKTEDAFSPRRSGRGVVPNRRYKDMEMDFTPSTKRRQSSDGSEKSKAPHSVKNTADKSKAKGKVPKSAAVVILTPKQSDRVESDHVQSDRVDNDRAETDHVETDRDHDDQGVVDGQQEVVMETVEEKTVWMEDEVATTRKELVIETMEEYVDPDVGSHHDTAESSEVQIARGSEVAGEVETTESLEDIAQRTIHILMRESDLGSSGENFTVVSSSGEGEAQVDTCNQVEGYETGSYQVPVGIQMETGSDQVPVGTDSQMEGETGSDQVPVGIQMEGKTGSDQTPVGTDSQMEGETGSDQVPVGSQMEGETGSDQVPVGSRMEGKTGSDQVPVGIQMEGKTGSDQVPVGIQMEGETESDEVLVATCNLMAEGTASDQVKDSEVVKGPVENLNDNSVITLGSNVAETEEESNSQSALMDVDPPQSNENQVLNDTSLNSSDSPEVIDATNAIVYDETLKDMSGYKIIRLEDMVQELDGYTKASELTATAVTNIERDIDEEIIRKILLSNKAFKDSDEIEIQIIGGDDSVKELIDTDKPISESRKHTIPTILNRSKMASSSTQTPIIKSRIANLPGMSKTSTAISAPHVKTIRVNIQRPGVVDQTTPGTIEEGKPQEFVIVHLPEGTKVTRPRIKDSKNEEAVPFDLTENGDFLCGVCTYTTPKKANWYKHKKKHMESGVQVRKYCKETVPVDLAENGDFVCGMCAYTTPKKANWYKHKIKHVGEQKTHTCPKCGHGAATSSNLKRHMAIHDDIRDYQCHICLMEFRQKIHLERHIKYRHEVKRVKCPLCDYVCANENPDLKVHIKRRHLPQDSIDGSIRAFTCEECGVMAVSRKDLKQHMKFHRKGPELKLYCEHCSFVTDCESRLRRHMFIHTNEKPFQCGLCQYRGTQKEHVLRHMKSQHNIELQKKGRSSDEASIEGSTDSRDMFLIDKKPFRTDYSCQEKIFACNHCSMKFSKLLNLYKHLHAQHKGILPDQGEDEYLCVVCDFRTVSKKNLLVHMRKHNVQDQNPPSHVYSCVLCRYMNPKRRNLFQHMKKKHNIEIVMKDDGSTSCFLTDSSSTVGERDESVQNILTVGDVVTATTEDSQLQIVMDDGEKSAVHVQNVISFEDIANCVANPQPNSGNIIILEQSQPNTFVQHKAAEAIEGLQALAEQPGILDSQEVITDPDMQTLCVEEVQTSKVLAGNVMETEIITMDNEDLKSLQQESKEDVKIEKESEPNIQLSADQLMNLSSGDYVEINGEMYKVEISAEDGSGAETRTAIVEEYNPTLTEESEEQQATVSEENAFQEFVQLMSEYSEDVPAASISSDSHTNADSLILSDNRVEVSTLQVLSDSIVDNSSPEVNDEPDSLTVLAEITNAASEIDTGYITIEAGSGNATERTEPSNVMTVVNSTNAVEGTGSV